MAKLLDIRDCITRQIVWPTDAPFLVPRSQTWYLLRMYVIPPADFADKTHYGDVAVVYRDRILHRLDASTLMRSWQAQFQVGLLWGTRELTTKLAAIRDANITNRADLHDLTQALSDADLAHQKLLNRCAPSFNELIHLTGGSDLCFSRYKPDGTSYSSNQPLDVEAWFRVDRSVL